MLSFNGFNTQQAKCSCVQPESSQPECPDTRQGDSDTVDRQEFTCGKDQTIIKHQHVVKHQHDIINEYDVVHEHDYNYYDVVKQRDVVRHNNYATHQQNYCESSCDNRKRTNWSLF